VLEVRNLSVRFGGLIAVNDLSFTIKPGEICAVIGPNGAGKSSLFNAITGYVPVASGEICFNGVKIQGFPPHRVATLGIARTFQHNGLVRDMSVLENVILGLELTTKSSLLGVILGLPGSAAAETAAVKKAKAMLDSMQLAGLKDRTAGDLPFGQQRSVELCRVLVSGAKVLLLDEPAVGLTERERRNLTAVLRRIAEQGVAVVLIEHVLDVVRSAADRVIVMNYGSKLIECAPSELTSHQSVVEAYLGHG
jgi:branched-chain amino acid transport system ATP-binding protein